MEESELLLQEYIEAPSAALEDSFSVWYLAVMESKEFFSILFWHGD